MEATSEAFDAQVGFHKRNFDLINTDVLDSAVASRRGRFCLTTFDDAYLEHCELAFPILRRHGVSGAVFVTTNFIDNQEISSTG